jgi:hypothetical protein
MLTGDFDVQGRPIRAVESDGTLYLLFRVAATTVILKSDGTRYTIDASGRCSCKGFKYRQTCKHVTVFPRSGL